MAYSARKRRSTSAGRLGSTAARIAALPRASADTAKLALLEAFIADGGQIAIGRIGPIACAAVANDEHNMLAGLTRRPGETLPQLLMRLQAAVQLALDRDCFIDEINEGPSSLLP